MRATQVMQQHYIRRRSNDRSLMDMLCCITYAVVNKVPNGIARVLFTVDGAVMILLHGFDLTP